MGRDFQYFPSEEFTGKTIFLGKRGYDDDKNVPEIAISVPWSEKIKFTKGLKNYIVLKKNGDILMSVEEFSLAMKDIMEAMESKNMEFVEVIKPLVEKYGDEWLMGLWAEKEMFQAHKKNVEERMEKQDEEIEEKVVELPENDNIIKKLWRKYVTGTQLVTKFSSKLVTKTSNFQPYEYSSRIVTENSEEIDIDEIKKVTKI